MSKTILYRSLNDKSITIPGYVLQEEPSPEYLKWVMETSGITVEDVAGDLFMPVQRVIAALKRGKYEGSFPDPNPHVHSTRILISIYINSGLWKERKKG